jgi:hypothetical protein
MPEPEQSPAPARATLGSRVKSWDATCDHCGEKYSPDTPINAVWSPTLFYISCRCSPGAWVCMEASP